MNGDIQTNVNYQKNFNAEFDKIHILNDIPKNIDAPVHWRLRRQDGGTDSEVSISFQETSDIPFIPAADELGALKIKGSSGKLVEAVPPYSVSVHHGKINKFLSDVTPEGDSLLWLPPGLWNIKIRPDHVAGIDYMQTCLVPVTANQTTILTLPDYMVRTLSEKAEHQTVEKRKGLNISGVKENKEGLATTFFTLFDQDVPEIKPAIENTFLLENGFEAEIKSIERVKTPADIVLLIDSSGSMKGRMEETIEAARRFVSSLPDNTYIKVIDFDTKPKELPGQSKDAVLSGLPKIRADGATALYDSILNGLELLNGRKRPSLLVFTDGVDANWNDTGPGSMAGKEQVFSAVKSAGIPLYTIGFGAGRDSSTLAGLADVSGGLYYPALDQTALDRVFTAIKNDFGNTFQLTYQRPGYSVANSVPVISIAIDTSGSMDPLAGGILQKVKNLFHDFILKLPEQTLVQVQDYDETTNISQMLTPEKSRLLQALGELTHRGNNDTFRTVKTAYESIQAIPSDKKILIYVSDQDLGLIRPAEKKEFEKLLKKFKEEEISVLWVGFCMDDAKDVFVRTAELSGGEFVISEDPQILAEAFDGIIAEISAVKPVAPEASSVSILVSAATDRDTALRYSDTGKFPLSAPEIIEQIKIPHMVSYKTGLPFERYDPIARKQLGRDDYPDQDTVIRKQITLDGKGGNTAVDIKARNALTLSRFKGLDAPPGKQFAALFIEMENVLPEQEVIIYPDGGNHPAAWVSTTPPEGKKVRKIPSYLINNLASHLYLNWNNKGKVPVSPVTWLAQTPFLEPGSLIKFIDGGRPEQGVVLFEVPDERVEQISLHFYDKNYGHATLPLIGAIVENEIDLEELPLENQVSLSESFSLRIKGVSDVDKIETVGAEKDSLFRIIEADFVSGVQALMDIDPARYFYYRIPTEQGPFYIALDPATQLLPFGFSQPVIFAPGSADRIRFAFAVPNSLAQKHKGEIFVELGDGDVILPLGDNTPLLEPEQKYSGDGIDLAVNRLAMTGDNRFLVADITLFDHPDGNATRLADSFMMVRDDFSGIETQAAPLTRATGRKGLAGFSGNRPHDEFLVRPDKKTREILLGFDDDTIIFDGTARRGILIFTLPSDKNHSWTLQSDLFAELKKTVDEKPFVENDWLVHKSPPLLNDDKYKERLNAALTRRVRAYNASAEKTAKSIKRISIDPSQPIKETIAVPPITFAGLREFSGISNIDELRSVLADVRWLPGAESGWIYNFSPEAVLSQGWGTEADFARMWEKVLVRMGYQPEKRMVDLKPKGIEALNKLGNVDQIKSQQLPAVYYKDEASREHLLVFPFLKELNELEGLVEVSKESDFYTDPGKAYLEVFLSVTSNDKDRNAQMRDMSNMLGGNESGDADEEIRILEANLDLDELSMDAIDLGYTVVGSGKGDLISPMLDTARQRIQGKEKLDLGLYTITGEKISIRIGQRGGQFSHERVFSKKDRITGIFHTIGINLPDLTEKAASELQKRAEEKYAQAQNPDELSTLRWYSRNIINRFLVGQSRYERELARKFDLTLGRTQDARCLMVTVQKKSDESKLQTSIDLMRVENQIHSGEKPAQHAFNIFSGLSASCLEAKVLPGDQHLGLFDIWKLLPEDTHLVSITYQNKRDIIDYMKNNQFSKSMIDHINSTQSAILIPSRPAVINGKDRWAWLEINPDDYRTIAVLDTGEKGAMLEHVLGNWQQEGANFIVGGLIGVDAALWSVSGFSLALEDYDEIKKEAQAFAGALAENLDGIGGTPSVSASMGPVSGSFDLVEGKAGVSQNVLGFAKGFSAGVALYFSMPD